MHTSPHFHIIGGGIAGLSASTWLTERGQRVSVYESSPALGGRCRSYADAHLDTLIDNGNHLVWGNNHQLFAYLERIGGASGLDNVGAVYPFYDLSSGERYSLRAPWFSYWSASTLISLIRALLSGRMVCECFSQTDRFYQQIIEPLCVAVFNSLPSHIPAPVLRQFLLRAWRPNTASMAAYIPNQSLSAVFCDPAQRYLEQAGAQVHLRCALASWESTGAKITRLHFSNLSFDLSPSDSVILALPWQQAAIFLQGAIHSPDAYSPIINIHFQHKQPVDSPCLLGILGGLTQWLFIKPGVISTTTSAASAQLEMTDDALAATAWREVCKALKLGSIPLAPYRVIREKRATFQASSHNWRSRPSITTPYNNLWLAGDYVQTGLPATLESAATSGHLSARAALAFTRRSG